MSTVSTVATVRIFEVDIHRNQHWSELVLPTKKISNTNTNCPRVGAEMNKPTEPLRVVRGA
jgi:hypothetical protein